MHTLPDFIPGDGRAGAVRAEDGAGRISEIQLRIIEALVFEDKTVTDVRREMDLTITEIRMEIRDMRKALLASM